jgi:hypothetical protein
MKPNLLLEFTSCKQNYVTMKLILKLDLLKKVRLDANNEKVQMLRSCRYYVSVYDI